MGRHVLRLEERLTELLSCVEGIKVLAPQEHGSGVLSFTHSRILPERLAEALDGHKIAVRAGLHCAPVAHKTLGTASFGTVRVGVGHTNTEKECERFARTLKEAIKELLP